MSKHTSVAKTVVETTLAALSAEEILLKPRGEIRYALGRVVSGNAEPKHNQIFNFYKPTIDKYALKMHEFSVDWDVDKTDWCNIVSGHVVRMYRDELNKSLFDDTGTLR